MHPFSILTLGIFVAGYITARWDLVTRLYELAIFAWEYGVVVSLGSFCLGESSETSQCVLTPPFLQTRAAKGFAALTLLFLAIFCPTVFLTRKESDLVRIRERSAIR